MRNNKEIVDLVKYLSTERGYSLSELARRVDMAKSAISRYFNGTREFPLNKINDFASVLGVSPEYLLGVTPNIDILPIYNQLETDRKKNVYEYATQQLDEQNNVIKMPKQHEVKVYGAVSAGTGEYLLDNEPEVMPFQGEVPDKYDFAVVVNGDSMLPLFENQQIIFVRKTTDIRSGQIVVVDYDQQAYVKKYISDEHGKRFVSLNKKYDDMPINVDHEAKAFGVVVL